MRAQQGLALAFVCFLCSGRIHGFQIHPGLATNTNSRTEVSCKICELHIMNSREFE